MKKTTELDKAQQVIVEEHKKRIKECSKEIDIVLKKYGFTMKVSSRIILLPLRENNK